MDDDLIIIRFDERGIRELRRLLTEDEDLNELHTFRIAIDEGTIKLKENEDVWSVGIDGAWLEVPR